MTEDEKCREKSVDREKWKAITIESVQQAMNKLHVFITGATRKNAHAHTLTSIAETSS